MAEKKVAVIGAGLCGLAVAALLARKGLRVTVLEKNSTPGGRARCWKKDGFSFDMGPSWYLMPSAFQRYFNLFDSEPEDFLKLVRLDPQFRVFPGTPEYFDISDNLESNHALFDSLEPQGAAKTERYLEIARRQYDVAVDHFLYREYEKWSDFVTADILRNAPRLGVFKSVHDLASREISDERLQQILEFTMVFIGGAPRKTPGLYALMSSIVLDQGVWYPMGGIGQLVEALYTLGIREGVTFEFNAPVRHVHTREGRAVAVETDSGEISADAVVSNADYHHTESALITPENRSYGDGYWRRRVFSPSAFILYLGVKGRLSGLQHHNLYFERQWDKHFGEVFRHPAWPREFSYYVCCPTQSDSGVAPAGMENLFMLVPVAPFLEDNDDVRSEFSDRVLTHFETLIGQSVRSRIAVQRTFSQRDFISDYNTLGGTAFSLSHTLRQTALFRPHRRSRRIKNLFYAGQYTHPGVGMPMVMIAAELAANGIANEFGG